VHGCYTSFLRGTLKSSANTGSQKKNVYIHACEYHRANTNVTWSSRSQQFMLYNAKRVKPAFNCAQRLRYLNDSKSSNIELDLAEEAERRGYHPALCVWPRHRKTPIGVSVIPSWPSNPICASLPHHAAATATTRSVSTNTFWGKKGEYRVCPTCRQFNELSCRPSEWRWVSAILVRSA